MDNSVKNHAKDIKAPNITDTALINMGFDQYTHSCIGCHGAPGITRPASAPKMYPQPPALAKAAKEWTPSELFWITKNGIKMTGMPEFGSAKNDNQIWSIVAFVKKMNNMTPEEFNTMKQAREPQNTRLKKNKDRDGDGDRS